MVCSSRPGLREDVAHGEHAERADAGFARALQDDRPRVLVQHVEGQHHHLEGRLVAQRPLQHLVRRIARAGLGDGEVAQLALLLLAQQGRHELGDGVVVLRRRQPVQVEQVDVVGAEPAQRGVEARDHGVGRLGRAGCRDVGLGRDDELITRAALDGLADDLLGAVRLGRVDQIDAEVEGFAHQRDGLRSGEAGALADAAVAAAAEPGDADFQAGAAEGGVLHAGATPSLVSEFSLSSRASCPGSIYRLALALSG